MKSNAEQEKQAMPSAERESSQADERPVAIRFDHVYKTYDLYKTDMGRVLGVFNFKKKSSYMGSVNANDDLSFVIHKGDAVAFLGKNGAGKSTALKMITGVKYPTRGNIEVSGRVSALLDLSAGFDVRLTGRENIKLRGRVLGMNKMDIEAIEPGVVEFAELGPYIDQPLRTYSSGMRSRLGFGIAVAIDPEILIVDEALSVGDRVFRQKCVRRVREIVSREGTTVLFVTHSSSTAKEFCKRGIVLEKGRNVFDGPISDAIAFYDAME